MDEAENVMQYRGNGDVLVVNAGSTSLKLHLVDETERSEQVARLDSVDGGRLAAVAHRVVHGGSRFRDPVAIDDGVREQIFAEEPLAPLHNAPALEQIDRLRETLPGVPQVAVFDTGFHATIPAEAATYPVPRRWREEWGVHRYGFHGISVAWSAERAPQLLGRPPAGLRLVVCHLGGGCSVSAVRGGRSLDNTMGFSPLEGVPMATRSGSVDPGALIYLLRERGLDAEALEHTLNFDSGLRGLAGGSGDMLQVEEAAADGDADAALAIEVFAHSVAAAGAAMAASAGGVDALVFTAGIGEGSAPTRERICERLAFLGVELDPGRNAAAEPDCDVASGISAVRVLVIRAREELVAARAARRLLPARSQTSP
jgi:acetate kinase